MESGCRLPVILDNKSPDLGVMGPHTVLDDPSLFTAVTLKVYSNPAFRSGIVTDVVSTLMSGMGMGLKLLSFK